MRYSLPLTPKACITFCLESQEYQEQFLCCQPGDLRNYKPVKARLVEDQ